MRDYVQRLRDILEGRPVYPALPLQIRRPPRRVPVHIAAVGPKMVELAGEVADGVILNLVPLSGLRRM